jgi:hypothetical protein
MTRGLHFEIGAARLSSDERRMDVACFIGFVAVQAGAETRLSSAQWGWLLERGFATQKGNAAAKLVRPDLLHIPVPCDSWTVFDQLFAAQSLPVVDGDARRLNAYLAACVRSFFRQGGRKCYVVRCGDPLALLAPRAQRLFAIGSLLPQYVGDERALSPVDPLAWRGIAHLHGLPDVNFLSFPDLPALVAEEVPGREPPPDPPVVRNATFVECAPPAVVSKASELPVEFDAPRCASEMGYRDWGNKLRIAVQFLRAHGRQDVQLVATIPLPLEHSPAALDLLGSLVSWGVLEEASESSVAGVSSALVQLTYPWVRWEGSAAAAGGVEPSEGVLLGVLARSVLLSGAFRSAGGRELRALSGFEPELSSAQLNRLAPLSSPNQPSTHALAERVSLLARTGDGLVLSSDVTTSVQQAYRAGCNNRLMSVWVRALRSAGEQLAFENSGEGTWALVRRRLTHVGDTLFAQGALQGRTADEAYSVRCDRSTMTEADLENGRLVAEVSFQPLSPVGAIQVAMAVDESLQVAVTQTVQS